jgi:hypothetical protein
MILSGIKKPLQFLSKAYRTLLIERSIEYLLKNQTLKLKNFNFEIFKSNTNIFIMSMQVSNSTSQYYYSSSCSKPTLYASAYACMTKSLLGEFRGYSKVQKREWADYFDSFQSSDDGLFYDPVVLNDIYIHSDWWGARHLALHMISAYTDIDSRPKYPFTFLYKYYELNYISNWLNDYDWNSSELALSDIDNKIMNIGCLLQYQRDYWGDKKAGEAIKNLKYYLRKKINIETGMWGKFNTADADQCSRMVQFAYHLLILFFYDKEFDFEYERIVGFVLKTQNKFGGYGVSLNSSACEDIDSIDILIRLYPFLSESTKIKVNQSLYLAFKWTLLNKVVDHGFVFRLGEPFIYGSSETSSLTNSGAMFPTWFRTLSIAYLCNHLNIENNFLITTCPGYEIQ